MSEKPRFEWTNVNVENREGESLKDGLMREAELNIARDAELQKARENMLEEAREADLEKARATEVQKIMAEEAARDRELEKATDLEKAQEIEKNRGLEPAQKIETASPYDSEMTEITFEKPKRVEIDVIGQGTKVKDEKLAKVVEEYLADQKRLEELKKQKAELDKIERQNVLVAVGVDWTKSEDKLAKKLAREDLKEELEDASIIKKIWKGKLFREYYEEKYINEYLDGDRTDKNGRSLYDIIEHQKDELLDKVAYDVTEDVREYNREELDKNITPMDKETNEKIKSTIEDYARFMHDVKELRPEMLEDPDFVKEVDERFDKYMFRILENAEDEGKVDGFIQSNNYLDVAKEAAKRYEDALKSAKDKVEQDAAMAKVMVGFQAYNYKTRLNFSEEHTNALDKILSHLGPEKIGKVVSFETFSNAVDAAMRPPEEKKIIEDIKSGEDLIGGEEGIKILLDESPISVESQVRWRSWWDGLTDEGRAYVGKLVKEVNSYPDRYNLKWGNGIRTWLTIVNARTILENQESVA